MQICQATPLFLLRLLNVPLRNATEKYQRYYPELPVSKTPPPTNECKILHLFGRFVRQGRPPPHNYYEVLRVLKPGGPMRMAPQDNVEWCLFLYAEKDWKALVNVISNFDLKLLSRMEQRSVIFDLAWLCKYRLSLKFQHREVSCIKNWIAKNRLLIPSTQAKVLDAFDHFLSEHPNGDREEIIATSQSYTPHFVLSAVTTMFAKSTPFYRSESLEHEWIRTSDKSVVVSISMDANYAEKFLPIFEKQLREINPEIGLHFCAVGFDPTTSIWPSNVGLSKMALPKNRCTSHSSRRAFYASARYINLEDCLERYSKVHVTDIDGLVTSKINVLRSAPITLHSKLCTAPVARLPFERVSAAGVSVNQSSDGRIFAKYLKAYLQYGFSQAPGGHWYIDQNALFAAWQDLKYSIDIETDVDAFFKQGGNWRLAGGEEDKILFQKKHLL